MTTVLTAGTFDGLHPGHEDLFRQAKALGDHLVVIVARDQTVLKVKGRLPRMGEDARLQGVVESPLVDAVVLGDLQDRLAVICEVKPSVIMLGYDQQAFTEQLEERLAERGVTPQIVRASAFHPDRYKSSLLYEKAQNG